MRSDRILHPALAEALAEVGHGDIVMVTDAGFPIPRGARRIDLGLVAGTIDVLMILRVVRSELFAEEMHMAPEVKTEFPSLYSSVQDICTGWGADFVGTPHEELVETWAPQAKIIIRSGSLVPWANFAIVAATDPFAWFKEGDGATVIPRYLVRRERIMSATVPTLK